MDPQITVPPLNQDVVDWFHGHYDGIYAILHPFIKVSKEYRHLFYTGLDVELTRSQLKEFTNPVSWASVLELAGISAIQKLCEYLAGVVSTSDYSKSQAIEKFRNQLELNDLVEPREGAFPELLLDDFLHSFIDYGYESVFVGSEFGERATKYQVSEMLGWQYPTVKEWHPTLYTEDHSLLYGVNWDCYYTFLCGAKEIVTEIVEKYNFEGFFFEPGMRVSWVDW